MELPEILEMNIYDPFFENKFLLIGSCVPRIYPAVLNDFQNKFQNVCTACLEKTHYNKIFAKLIDILATGNTKRVAFLTVDGSPHCVQMHFMSKYLKRALKNDIKYLHYVITKDREIYSLEIDVIDESKNFAKKGKKFQIN
ncbi:hypothetical protein GF362_07300 [Candidatus Dojkabacteria bacterium]|nr:hypothetical protein [Candidatus Dojkabacteria bacterium]